MTELKPCPFCRGRAKKVGPLTYDRIECQDCSATLEAGCRWDDDSPELIWNRRAPDPEKAELVAALREVWESVPVTYDPDDPMVQRHARALNAVGALLHRIEGGKG